MPDGRVGRFEVPEGTSPEKAQSLISQEMERQASSSARDYTTGEMLSKAVTRGTKQVGSALGDVIPAMVAKGLGFDEYAKQQMEEAAQTQAEINANYAPQYASYKDVHGPGQALGYLAESVAEQAPNLATALVPGGIGAAVGRRAATAGAEEFLASQMAKPFAEELTRKEAIEAGRNLLGREATLAREAEFANKGAQYGMDAGIYLGSLSQNVPEVFQNIYDASGGKMEPGAALLAGSVSAAFDSAFPAYLVNKFSGPKKVALVEKLLEKSGMKPSLIRTALSTLPEASLLEGMTEGAQEAISIEAEKFVNKNKDKFNSDDWNRVLESTIKGGAAGLGLGVPGAIGSRAREKYGETAYGQTDSAGPGENIPVPGQPPLAGLPGATQEGNEPGATELADVIGGPTGRETVEPSPLKVATAEATIRQQAEKAAEEEAAKAEKKAKKEKEKAEAEVVEAPAKPLPKVTNLNQEAEDILDAHEAGKMSPDQLVALPRVLKENDIPPTRDKTTKQYDDNIMLQALQDKRDAYRASQMQEARMESFAPEGKAVRDIDLDKLEARPQGTQTIHEIPAGTRLYHGAHGARADELNASGNVMDAKAPYKSGGGTLDEGGLLWFGDKELAQGHADSAIDTMKARWEEEETGVKRRPGRVFTTVTTEPLKLINKNYKVTQEEADKLNEAFNFPPYKQLEEGDELSRAAYRAVEYRAANVPRYKVGEDEMTAAWPVIFKALGVDGFYHSSGVAIGVDKVATSPLQNMQEARSEGAVSNETKESITEHLKKEFGNNIDTAQKRGHLQIANSVEDLPKEVQDKMAPNAVGAYHKGTSYLVANRMNKDTARRTLLHEVGEHHGLEGMLGKDLYKQILRSLKTNKDTNKDIAKAWGDVERLYPELQPNNEQFLREVLAKVGENAPENTLWRRVVGAVKNFLTKLGLYNPNKFTTADLHDLITHSLRQTLKQPRVTPSPETQLGKTGKFNEAFKRWFGNSKVVDEKGEPLVVYHGTSRDISEFKSYAQREETPWKAEGKLDGIYFSTSPQFANMFVSRGLDTTGANILPVYLSIKNPYVFPQGYMNQVMRGISNTIKGLPDKKFISQEGYRIITKKEVDKLKALGYDGAMSPDKSVIIAFDSNQIKSAVGNVGTYSSDTGNIMLNKVDPAQAARLLQSVGDVVKNAPGFNSELGVQARAALSKIGPTTRKLAMSFLSLPNKIDLYGDRLPQLRQLLSALEQRASAADKMRSKVDIKSHEYIERLKKHPTHIIKKFNRITLQLSAADIFPGKKFTNGMDNVDYDPNNDLVRAYENLPADLQKLGIEIHDEYQKYSTQMIDTIEKLIGPGTKAALALRKRFESNRLKFYHPLRRKGQYWASYTDKNGDTAVIAAASPAEREIELKKRGAKDAHLFTRLDRADYKQAPPIGFVSDVIKQLDKQLNENNVDPEVAEGIKNQVYQTYLDLLPAESLRQQFRAREGIPGYIEDVVGGYADVASKMANQLTNLEYRPQIDAAISDMKVNIDNLRREGAEDIEALTDVAQDVLNQKEFLDNPIVDGLSARLSWVSYIWNIAGNVSSALVNLTQLFMVVYPMLAGRYGWGKATSMMGSAISNYFKGGLDTNRKFMPDWTFGANLKQGDKYYNLYQEAIKQSAMRRGVGYELTELRHKTAEEFTGKKAKVETALGWIFQNSERMNREVTLMAAYDLAKESGMDEKAAIDYAVDLTTRAHSHTLSEAGPKMFQTGWGKVAFTFKRFAQAQIYNVARLAYVAFKGLNPEEQKVARKQLMGIMGMTYVFSGVQGLPLYGAANMLSSALAAMFGDDDEPYDFDEEVRSAIGMLGYKGPVNLVTNIDIAGRTGFNGMVWRDDPRRLAEVGFAPYFAEHFFGPAYQAMLVNPVRAAELWNQGHTERALEQVVPTFVRSPLKAVRFANEGALTTNGAKIVDDVSAYSAFMQIWGFSNAELTEAYTRASAMKEAEKKIQDRRTSLLDLHYLAKSNGDMDMVGEIQDKIQGFNESHPAYKISPDTLKRSYRGHEQRIKDSTDGVYLNKKLRPELEEEYGA